MGATKRKPWEDIFFNNGWDTPLDKQTAGDYEIPLEMLRLAPSATNKQPWRIVKDKENYHFFLQRAAGYDKMTSAADLQRIDMGIAMCHFEMTAKEQNLSGGWFETDTWSMPLPKKCEYIVTVEEAQIIGGLGGAVAEFLSSTYPKKIKRIGVKDHYGESGSPDKLLKKFGFSAQHIYKEIIKFCQGGNKCRRRK